MTVGTGSKFDRALNQYFPNREDDLLGQLVEDETDALLLAVLMELQKLNGDDPEVARDTRPDQQFADYFVTETSQDVTTVQEQEHTLNWGFPATSVTIWGFDEPIYAAFAQNGDNRLIPLAAQDAPFTVAPEGGLDSSELRLRLPDRQSNSTQVKILALK
jgi:hypothetical protein